MTGRRRSRTNGTHALAAGFLVWAAAGCSLDSLLKNDEVPPGTSDPAITQTPQGALAVYRGVGALFRVAFGQRYSFVSVTGLLSDELRIGDPVGDLAASVTLFVNPTDGRMLPELGSTADNDVFATAQRVRAQAGQAIGLLTRYSPEQRALIGHAYALEGYAEVMLAELFCSGIPLSTLDFDGDYTLRPGSTTAQVFTHAAALFDTALTFVSGSDSTRFVPLAAVGKARALLGLDSTRLAAEAAAAVPDAYQYDVRYFANDGSSKEDKSPALSARNFNDLRQNINGIELWLFSMANQEGGNGLDYITGGDPRSANTLSGTSFHGFAIYRPMKYAADGSSPIVLASGVEARLIQAEAALRVGDAIWLTILNALRTDGTFDTQPTADPTDDPAAIDTLWHKGSGGYDGLKPLEDPGTADGQVDLLFRERAFWLYLTGHRQGDLRRLIRQYDRDQSRLYPIGPYPGTPGIPYGDQVTMPIPSAERRLNPLFTGCISREA